MLGQDKALRHVSVAIYKHTTGKVSGNLLLVGPSGTGKTTIMNNIQRLYHEVPEYRPFRSVTIINANLLVDSDRMEFRPDRLLTAVEQRARAILGPKPSAADLKEAIERATICVDEIDKMSSVVAGRPNAIGVVLQQGLLTMMEGEHVVHKTHAWVDGEDRSITLDIDTGTHDVPLRRRLRGDLRPGLRAGHQAGQRRAAAHPHHPHRRRPGAHRDPLLARRLPQVAGPLRVRHGAAVPRPLRPDGAAQRPRAATCSRRSCSHSFDSPFVRSRAYFAVMGIELELEDLAAALIAERAARDARTGARSLRPIFTDLVNAFEFDPWSQERCSRSARAGIACGSPPTWCARPSRR